MGAIAIAPKHPDVVVLGTGEPSVIVDAIYGAGILRSTDGGATWNPTNVSVRPDSARGGFTAIVANAVTGVMLAAGREGLFRSEDEGATWARVDSSGFWTDVAWRPGSADTAFAVEERGGFFRSEDGGRSFTHLSSGLPPDSSIVGLSRVALSPSRPDYVYAAVCAPDSFALLGVYRSTDGGTTWSLRASGQDLYSQEGFFTSVMLVDPLDADALYAGGTSLFRSTDGGATWNPVQGDLFDYHAIAHDPASPGTLWAATDVGVFESGDAGATWVSRNAGLVTTQFYGLCFPDGTKSLMYGGSQGTGLLRYSGGPAWDTVPYYAVSCACDPGDPDHVYAQFPFGIHWVTYDGLQTVDLILNGLDRPSRFQAPFSLDPHDPLHIFTATKSGIYRSTNGGVLWEPVLPAFDVVSISVSPVRGNWVWALDRSDGKVRYSANGGDTWSTVQAAPFAGIGGTKILADPVDTLAAYAVFLSHPAHPPLVLRTYNGGASWRDMTGNLQGQSVNTIAVDPDHGDWYVGTQVGVWISERGSGQWRPYGRGLPYAVTLDLAIQRRSGLLRAATHGRGMWEVTLLGSTRLSDLAGASLSLERASSNPGSGPMLFRCAGRGASPLELRIVAVDGRLVARLGTTAADGVVRTTSWDTRSVRTGVYFAVLESGGTKVTRKVVVLR